MGCYREGTAWTETHNNSTKRSARWWLSPHSRWTGWVESCWVHESGRKPRPARTHSQESAGLCAAAAVWTGAESPSELHSGAPWHSVHLEAVRLPPGKRMGWSPSTQDTEPALGSNMRGGVAEGWAHDWEVGKPSFQSAQLVTHCATHARCFLPLVLSFSINKT